MREPTVLLTARVGESHALSRQPSDHAAMFALAKDAPAAPPGSSGKPQADTLATRPFANPRGRHPGTQAAVRWLDAATVALAHNARETATALVDTLARLLTMWAFAHAPGNRIVYATDSDRRPALCRMAGAFSAVSRESLGKDGGQIGVLADFA